MNTTLQRLYVLSFVIAVIGSCLAVPASFPTSRIEYYREKVKSMFYHAYNGYLEHAYPLDELKPLTCEGMDTWGSFSLTLIDSLDTLIIMGNHSEFERAAQLVLDNVDVDANVNVSVFETNIRVIGGLLSAHILSSRLPSTRLADGWPCAGPLLDLAVKFANKLLPAFNTDTGMPYGTVNLKYGVNKYETPITCTAGVGTFIIEFGTLSKLTGDPTYERVALRALDALWKTRSGIGLVGNHVNTQSATDAGIGAGVDSYFEYLAKGGLLFQRPKLIQQFYEYEDAINKHIRKDDFFMWVSMTKGGVTSAIFQSLEAYWPSVLALLGKVDDAARIMLNYLQINRQFGVTPEFYNLQNHETQKDRAGYPLRPEMIESMMYLYRATRDPTYLHGAASMVEAIEYGTKTKCGYATIKDVNDFMLEDRMESFFLSETSKYLYLLFDEDNFIHRDGTEGKVIETTNGKCLIETGGYIFNTEAHPVDPSVLYCCSAQRAKDVEKLRNFEDGIDFVAMLDLHDPYETTDLKAVLDEADLPSETVDSALSEATDDAVEDELEYEEQRWSDNIQVPPTPAPEPAPPFGPTRSPSVFAEAATPTPVFTLMDSSWRANATERIARTKVNAEVAALVRAAKAHDRERHAAGDHSSNLSTTLVRLLTDMRDEFAALVRTSSLLATPNLDSIKAQLAKRQAISVLPHPVVVEDNICVPVEKSSDSLALRRMLGIIYSKHIFRKHGIRYVMGPICRPDERPPTTEELYSTQVPDLPDITPSELDSIEGIFFGTFRYRLFTDEQYELLTSETPPFASRFTGLGQVTFRNLGNATA
uniref:alpha-1,2-Mannosidase n=1 Tax=Panagrellus redivivus TaxID=6233 RepID=A0A7E4VUE7_PANRE